MQADVTAADVLTFWFEECTPAAWFEKNDAFDQTLRDRFAGAHAKAADGALAAWADTRDGRLALLIFLDQMSRNMFRDSAKAFAQDALARDVARRALGEGDHVFCDPNRCLFLFLPFEHSEALADQTLCLALFQALGNPHWIDYANRHKVIIERFGRFPHRNACLGRESTPEELAFLSQPGSSF